MLWGWGGVGGGGSIGIFIIYFFNLCFCFVSNFYFTSIFLSSNITSVKL